MQGEGPPLRHLPAFATTSPCAPARAAWDARLATHRATLEAGADPTVITQWIAETQVTRARAEADLRTATADQPTGSRMTRDEIARLVRSLSDLATVVRQADPEDKAEIYRQLGLQLTYSPGHDTFRAEITPDPHAPDNDKTPRSQRNRRVIVRVRRGLEPYVRAGDAGRIPIAVGAAPPMGRFGPDTRIVRRDSHDQKVRVEVGPDGVLEQRRRPATPELGADVPRTVLGDGRNVQPSSRPPTGEPQAGLQRPVTPPVRVAGTAGAGRVRSRRHAQP